METEATKATVELEVKDSFNLLEKRTESIGKLLDELEPRLQYVINATIPIVAFGNDKDGTDKCALAHDILSICDRLLYIENRLDNILTTIQI